LATAHGLPAMFWTALESADAVVVADEIVKRQAERSEKRQQTDRLEDHVAVASPRRILIAVDDSAALASLRKCGFEGN
jgi:hypothetical protein